MRIGTVALVGVVAFASSRAASPPEPVGDAHRSTRMPAIPVTFEENRGQTDEHVRFLAHAAGGVVFLAEGEVVFAGAPRPVRMHAVGADPRARVEPFERLPGRANYFRGSDASRWLTDLPTFAGARYRDLYPGIDLACHGNDGRFEYDFVLAPHADPAAIELAFDGADRVEVDAAGDLVLDVGSSKIRHLRPAVFEDCGGTRREVAAAFSLTDANTVRFVVAGHDPALPLSIDPTVVYASYLGGNGVDHAFRITRDGTGATFVCGSTASTDFPTKDPIQASNAGVGQFGDGDAFVAKLDPTGSSLVFSTYVGGSDDDRGEGIGIDDVGNVCIAGQSYSSNFPTTAGVVQTTHGGQADCFVAKLTAAGSALVFSTYLGTTSDDCASAMTLDSSGNVYVTGQTTNGLPDGGGPQTRSPSLGSIDAFVAKVNPMGTGLVYSYIFGGTGFERGLGIAVDAGGDAYAVGYTNSSDLETVNAHQQNHGGDLDAFLVHLDAAGTAIVFSTYLGGSGTDLGIDVALVGTPTRVDLIGYAESSDITEVSPLQTGNHGGRDVLFAEFTPTGSAAHVSYIGGSGTDTPEAIAKDAGGKVWIAGSTNSTDFPTVDAPQAQNAGGSDVFLARLAADATSLESSTYAGGSSDDFALDLLVDPDGTPYFTGWTDSTDYPTSAGAFQPTAMPATNAIVSTPPAPPAIDSFFLPKKVVAKANTKDASKSKLVASGFFDTGSGTPDLSAAATLTVGSTDFAIPALAASPDGRRFSFSGQGLTFVVTKNPFGSSRAKFKLKRTGDLAGIAPQNGDLELRFHNAVVDGRAEVRLAAGKFQLGRVRGALVAPNLFVVRAAATLKGAGKDGVSLIVGLATDGVTPAAAPDLHVRFGALDATIPHDQFQPHGDLFVFKGDVGGVTGVKLDYARETISIKARNATLGTFGQGANVVEIAVALGSDTRTVRVRASRKGSVMKY
jgi:beta-propeller repeat-containing protein